MSHNVKISTLAIRDLAVLKDACKALEKHGIKAELTEAKRFKTYPGQPNACDYKITVEGASYDIGVKKEADGTYSLEYDASYGGVAAKIGSFQPTDKSKRASLRSDTDYATHGLGKLVQAYGVMASKKQLVSQGYSCTERFDAESGSILLEAQLMGGGAGTGMPGY